MQEKNGSDNLNVESWLVRARASVCVWELQDIAHKSGLVLCNSFALFVSFCCCEAWYELVLTHLHLEKSYHDIPIQIHNKFLTNLISVVCACKQGHVG